MNLTFFRYCFKYYTRDARAAVFKDWLKMGVFSTLFRSMGKRGENIYYIRKKAQKH